MKRLKKTEDWFVGWDSPTPGHSLEAQDKGVLQGPLAEERPCGKVASGLHSLAGLGHVLQGPPAHEGLGSQAAVGPSWSP